ncbi:MAG: CapA family protein [Firmicutes bacterium]|nr:CapA family protein [Bacillota bacterium]MCM1401416.1 CapA family protein [Bacteroides sp.]MCM1477314.1 CapA family protein [Bacteroides sp.]
MSIFDLVLAISIGLFSPPSAELVFAGDAMQHIKQIDAARTSSGEYDYSSYFTALEPYIKSADFAVINLETPLAGAPYTGYPTFCAPDSYLTQIQKSGFDFILAANNHTLDKRDKGLLRTIDQFNKHSIPYAGIYRNKAERDSVNPVICDVNGFKIAFLNYTYGTNGIKIQGDVVVDYIDKNQIKEDIKKAREAGAEIIAACMHWGVEYVLLPNAEQKALADFLEDEGVDLIIGGHPHVIQPMEMRVSKKHNKKVFLVYSLGNFISAMRKDDTQGGAMARVKIKRNELGQAVVDTATYRLVFVSQPTPADYKFRLLPAEDKVAPQWQRVHDNFVRRASDIFNKHNVNVPLDTIPISSYAK